MSSTGKTENKVCDVSPPPAKKEFVGKSGLRICCACPDTKFKRDECVIMNGQENCSTFIEAHKACLRLDGFKV